MKSTKLQTLSALETHTYKQCTNMHAQRRSDATGGGGGGGLVKIHKITSFTLFQ